MIQSGPTFRKILRSTFPLQMIAERGTTLGAQGKLQESTAKSNEEVKRRICVEKEVEIQASPDITGYNTLQN